MGVYDQQHRILVWFRLLYASNKIHGVTPCLKLPIRAALGLAVWIPPAELPASPLWEAGGAAKTIPERGTISSGSGLNPSAPFPAQTYSRAQPAGLVMDEPELLAKETPPLSQNKGFSARKSKGQFLDMCASALFPHSCCQSSSIPAARLAQLCAWNRGQRSCWGFIFPIKNCIDW